VGYHRKESGAPPKEIQTPHIDQLVSEGVELDRHCGCCTELLNAPAADRLTALLTAPYGAEV
jgi:hypothetical protein